MLSKPEYGWTNFSLGKLNYSLSYINEIPIDWLKAAIFGLKNYVPFTVEGFCEPGHFICTVNDKNCYIIFENDENISLNKSNVSWDILNISKVEFCQLLYDDIAKNIDAWTDWIVDFYFSDEDFSKEEAENLKLHEKNKLQNLLEQLNALIFQSSF